MFATDSITEEEVRKLPCWARVAFAARCGRRVQPLLRRFWHNPQPQLLQAVESAIALAEESAAQARSSEGLAEAAQAAETYIPVLAGIAAGRAPGTPAARMPFSDLAHYSAATAAVAAAQAAQAAARGEDDASVQAAFQAYCWAGHAAHSVHVRGLDRVLQADLRALQQAASRGPITDSTSVGPTIFALEKDLRAFRRELPSLLAQAEGKFALVHEDQVDGVWDTYEDALQTGYQRYQLRPFLVKQVRAGEDLG